MNAINETTVTNMDKDKLREIQEQLGWLRGSAGFYDLLIQVGQLHSRKNQDYTTVHPLENFFRTACDANVLPEEVIEVMVSTKSVRIGSLLRRDGGPANEALVDSYIDRAVYSLLGAVIVQMDETERRRVIGDIYEELSHPYEEEQDDF